MTNQDFNIKITVRNSRLLSRIREEFGTPAEMARQTGLHYSRLSAYVRMKESPIKPDGTLREFAWDICSALGCYPDDIWPKHLEKVKLKRSSREVEISTCELEKISNAESHVSQRLLLEKWSSALNEREKIAVSERLSGATFEELGEVLGVTRERARQIEAKAHRKIKRAARSDDVLSYADIEP